MPRWRPRNPRFRRGSRSARRASAPRRRTGVGIDVNRLPIDLQRIERRFRQGQIREERDGLNLRYYIDVFAVAPRIVLFTKQDNLRYGPVPYGGPTHNEMLDMMTPRPFRNHGGVNILSPNSKK